MPMRWMETRLQLQSKSSTEQFAAVVLILILTFCHLDFVSFADNYRRVVILVGYLDHQVDLGRPWPRMTSVAAGQGHGNAWLQLAVEAGSGEQFVLGFWSAVQRLQTELWISHVAVHLQIAHYY